MPTPYDAPNDPTKYQDAGTTPPHTWQANAEDGRYWYDETTPVQDQRNSYIGTAGLPAAIRVECEIVEAPPSGVFHFIYTKNDDQDEAIELGVNAGIVTFLLTDHDRSSSGTPFSWGISDNSSSFDGIAGGEVAVRFAALSSVDCECETLPTARTLSDLRVEVLRNTGYAGQLALLPTGVAELYNSFLRQAQIAIATHWPGIETERFFRFPLTVGERFYDIRDNFDSCDKYLDPNNITSVHLVDNNAVWSPPLERGIPPEAYTTLGQNGYPANWDVRQCIEIYPAPQAAFTLYIKGRFGLGDFASDTDYTTVEPEPVFQWALGLAKNHKKPGSGGDPILYTGHFGQAKALATRAIARQHRGRRYIPQSGGGPLPTQIASRPELEEFI